MNIFAILVGFCYFVACHAAPVTTATGTCSFDTGLCGYSQDANDRFDWTRNNGSTPSYGTGPSGDKGFYLYIETSWPRMNKENAVLVSPVLDDKSMNCLEFFYHMKGVNIRTLNVYTQASSGSRTLRWSLTGHQDSTWLRASIPFQYQDKVVFEGFSGTGYMGDIAIDNITVYDDQNCQISPQKAIPVTTQTPDANLPSGECGQKQETRIVGGTAAQPGEWPWQAMLMYKSANGEWRQFCGGTLVAPDWVVTASHCVSDSGPSAYAGLQIRLGAHKVNQTSNVHISDIERIYVHEDYNAYPYGFDNDIALIKLKLPAMLRKEISPACIPNDTATFPPGTKCYITGWGTLKSGGDSPLELQEAEVPLVSTANCTQNGSYPSKEISPTMLCAGYIGAGGVDSCQGDSGGPLVCKNNDLWYLVGVTSWGYGCADPNYPGVYANVAVLHQWLANTMAHHVDV